MTQTDSTSPDITTATVVADDGTELGIHRLGSGSPVVIVHGSITTAESWMPVAVLLAADHSVFVLDRRGRGRSGDAEEYSLGTEAGDISTVLAWVKQETGAVPALVGHSYGAICALEAIRTGADVASLALYEPPLPVDGLVAGEHLAPYAAAIAASDNDAAIRIAMEHFVRVPSAETEMLAASPLWGQFLELAPTWTRELTAIDDTVSALSEYGAQSVRTLLLVGSESPAHLVGATTYLESALPDSTKYVLEGQSHFANMGDPDSVAGAIHSFVTQ